VQQEGYPSALITQFFFFFLYWDPKSQNQETLELWCKKHRPHYQITAQKKLRIESKKRPWLQAKGVDGHFGKWAVTETVRWSRIKTRCHLCLFNSCRWAVGGERKGYGKAWGCNEETTMEEETKPRPPILDQTQPASHALIVFVLILIKRKERNILWLFAIDGFIRVLYHKNIYN